MEDKSNENVHPACSAVRTEVGCRKMVSFLLLTTQSRVCLQAIRLTHERQCDLSHLPFVYFFSH